MGWTFNTANPDAPTDGPQIVAVAVIMTTLALTTVILRVYVRCVMLNAFGTDDFIIILSWLTSFGFTIVSSLQTRWGLGLHSITDLPEEDGYTFGILQFIGAPFYITSILGFKLSLLYSYLRFMPKGLYRNMTYVVILLTTLFHLSFLLVQINLCTPVRILPLFYSHRAAVPRYAVVELKNEELPKVQAQWDFTITNKTCLPSVTVYTTMASLTILFDVVVMVLPFPVLLGLKMQNRRKLVVLGLFGLGVFITIIQIIRIQTVKRLTVSTDSAPLIMWSAVESNLGIMVACVPCLSPLVKYFKERTTNASRRKTGRTGYQIGSQYALQTWKAKMNANDDVHGMEHSLGHAAAAQGGQGTSGTDSTDFILDTAGITRKTEVVITRE